eukprot:Hpha_TRINITY_DN32295_c0_g1::TRINITY_DN32295_c0_g1_i1::g.155173::m.155173
MPRQRMFGDDELFLVVLFSISAFFVSVVVFPSILVTLLSSKRRGELFGWAGGWLSTIGWALSRAALTPVTAASSVALVLGDTNGFREYVRPKVGRVFRFRVLVTVVFLYLLPQVAYTCLLYDPYQILGLNDSATDSEVRRAYKKLAMKHHPDKDTSEGARERFEDFRKAYYLIVDPAKWEKQHKSNTFEVGMALPSFLGTTGGSFAVAALIIIIPALFLLYGRSESRLQARGEALKRIPAAFWHSQAYFARLGHIDTPEFTQEWEERRRV